MECVHGARLEHSGPLAPEAPRHQSEQDMNTIDYAVRSAASDLAPFEFERRALRANDVAIGVLLCGACHSDLHEARNDWGWSRYPLVLGHEIVGRVTAVAAMSASTRLATMSPSVASSIRPGVRPLPQGAGTALPQVTGPDLCGRRPFLL